MVDGAAPAPMRLLLFSLVIRSSLVFAVRSYEITFPCEEELVCYHMWSFNKKMTRDYVAVATTGSIRASLNMLDCSQPIKDQTDSNVQICTNGTQVPFAEMDFPKISMIPGKAASLQCVLLTYGRRADCKEQHVQLRWLDEADAEVQADSEHQVEQDSDCNVTLTVNFKSPGVKKLKCRATVREHVRTSAELWVTVSALKRKGRVMIVAPGPDQNPPETVVKGDVVGVAVGVVGCVVVIATVAAFVVKRKRRSRNQLPGGSESTRDNNDEVVYADVILPVGSGQVLVREDTEYTCVQPK